MEIIIIIFIICWVVDAWSKDTSSSSGNSSSSGTSNSSNRSTVPPSQDKRWASAVDVNSKPAEDNRPSVSGKRANSLRPSKLIAPLTEERRSGFMLFINGLTEAKLKDFINKEYDDTKGYFDECRPYYDIGTSVKFTLFLLLRGYVKQVMNTDLAKYGPFLLNSADIAAYAFMGMSEMEWTMNLMDLITKYEEIISYSDWDDALCIIEDKYKSLISTMVYCYRELNGDNTREFMNIQYYYKNIFCPVYNSSLHTMKAAMDYYRRKGMRFNEITFNIAN